MEQHPLINILTYGLPGNVTRPIYREYNNRRRELDRIWANPENHYQELQNSVLTIETLLAFSLFYRHVMGHMQGAVSFYKSVNQKLCNERACVIQVGKTILDYEQQRHLLSAVMTFDKIRDKYKIPPAFFEYSDTIQFMRNCKDLFYVKEYEEDDTI